MRRKITSQHSENETGYDSQVSSGCDTVGIPTEGN